MYEHVPGPSKGCQLNPEGWRFDHEISNSNIPGTLCYVIKHPGDVIHLPRAKKSQFILKKETKGKSHSKLGWWTL